MEINHKILIINIIYINNKKNKMKMNKILIKII